MTTRGVSVSRLKARLSAYLAAVRGGATVTITERGRPIARLGPVTAADDWPATLDGLVARGLARRPTGVLDDDFFERPRVKDPEGMVLQALLSERGRHER